MSGPVKLSRRLHTWWCPSVNSFKFQPCDHTPPQNPKALISHKMLSNTSCLRLPNP
ncbi:hypothetical protein BDN71DRAFT_1476447 [Pleurotus eryngii]|uniref:Uncharacterized protein n=1 Tax=Pleurotus eryngii TaxID=5323 RepID=A0A9P5ZMV4_PLEER|nr:hypothetical protein BDN71DRAFT_1476447 [Pleurotus eryngii]